jgi:hypothetical protein
MERYRFKEFMRVVKKSNITPVAILGYKVINKQGDQFTLVPEYIEHPELKNNKKMQAVVKDAANHLVDNIKESVIIVPK